MKHEPADRAGRIDLLRRIVQLKETISTKQKQVDLAHAALESAKQNEIERRRALKAIDNEIRSTDQEVHRKSTAVYLGGQSPNRGWLSLGNQAIHFAGWRGHFDVPLEVIADVQVGTATIPPRSGLPVVEHVWPGDPRHTAALLLTTRQDDGSSHLTVLADVADAWSWCDAILEQQRRLDEVVAWHNSLVARRQQAIAALDAATQGHRQAQSMLGTLTGEVAALQAQLQRAEHAKLKSTHPEADTFLEETIRIEHEALKRLDETQGRDPRVRSQNPPEGRDDASSR